MKHTTSSPTGEPDGTDVSGRIDGGTAGTIGDRTTRVPDGNPGDGTAEPDDTVRTVATGPAPGAAMSGLAEPASDGDPADAKPLGGPELRPAAVFSHDMVLQRRRPIPVFGTGTPGRTVVVTLRASDSSAEIALAGAGATPHTTTDSVTRITVISTDGRWIVRLPAVEAGGPYELTVTDRSGVTLVYRNVAVGEVWLAGGQSNMELELRNADDADAVIAASADPLLRFYNTPKTGVIDEDAEDHARWHVAGPASVGTMSAVAYHFARRLRRGLGPGIAVGIVDCYIGGTSISAWMSRRTLESCEAGRGYLARFDAAIAGRTDEQFAAETTAWQTKFDAWNAAVGAARAAEPDITWDTLNERYGACPWPPPVTPTSQYRPTGPYGTMVERVAPYGIAGFLWYQGEEDEAHCDSYRTLLGLFIDEWRGLWRCADQASTHAGVSDGDAADRDADGGPLPFLIVQLPQWIDKTTAAAGADPRHWPVIREAQWDAGRTIDGVYTVTTIDCGEFDNIHPTDKRTPGERLADCALHRVYGRYDIPVDGPQVASVEFVGRAGEHDGDEPAIRPDGTVDDAPGAAIIRFSHADGLRFDGTVPGTYRRDVGDPLHRDADASGFELSGADGVWHPADAAIVADGTIRVRCDDVPFPVAVRYAWRSWGPAPLFNVAGLPAPPFRR
ncbi:sialate O-acetylesterase [Bifidobacterium samirii]|uniref:9-O-acetylesterase n=1 Tax=Bifidobacterium samirii TaxID=2306974 RepID=A0A430FWK5_9BIFI|nr:sialate O-acetylesterase [Bifidobacterium samirii]RSX58487.1 9-O-acetylesterase [Bifidobacterium samirii]